jgi:hypothetical protein
MMLATRGFMSNCGSRADGPEAPRGDRKVQSSGGAEKGEGALLADSDDRRDASERMSSMILIAPCILRIYISITGRLL